jgi:hypothetical protein
MNEHSSDSQLLLRRALYGNALFSVLSSIVILVANRRLVDLLGLQNIADLKALGIGLLMYAGWLFWNAKRQTIGIMEAWIAVTLDMLWVVGSYALLFAVTFSGRGKWIVVLVAEMVLLFGVMQWLGLRRVGRGRDVL